MRVVVVSDTHAPWRWRRMPNLLAAELRHADLVLHAGDVCTVDVLVELAAYAPVRVVLGNNDGAAIAAWGAPEMLDLELAGVRIGMVHNASPSQGRAARLRALFPAADVAVFGHSHIPVNQVELGLRLFNPGSPSDPRREPLGSFGVLDLVDGRVVGARHVYVPGRPRAGSKYS